MKSKNTKRALLMSVLSMMLCMAMLVGSTFAWFTDSVTSGKNKIVAGNLDVELDYSLDGTTWTTVDENTNMFKDGALWEPGYTEVVYLRVRNAGSLALKYQFGINVADKVIGKTADDKDIDLANFIEFGVVEASEAFADRAAARDAVKDSARLISAGYSSAEGHLTAGNTSDMLALVVYMPETVGNDANYGTGKTQPEIYMGINLVATQDTVESDSFDENYDANAKYPWDGVTMTKVIPDSEGNYNISNGSELAWIAQQVNANDAETVKMSIILQDDIDLNGKEWTPIGGENVFSGVFDGNGHTIKNLKASKCDNPGYEDRSIGLIGYAEDVTVRNLKIENCEISGRYGAGAVVGEADGPILFENIEVLSGTIIANQDSSNRIAQVAGGILGIGYGAGSSYDGTIVFRNCVNYSDITVNKQHAGGLWGSITYATNADVTIENCHNYGKITSLSKDSGGYAGGLGGYFAAKSLTIINSTNNGTVTADKYQGNFVGYSTLANNSVND